tara:strand:- start:501 stop:695 length:195 start_codon:yes stop_codon:yes gene_type:complete
MFFNIVYVDIHKGGYKVTTNNSIPVTAEEFAKKIEEKYTRRKTAKKKTQLRKQQRKHKREKYCA